MGIIKTTVLGLKRIAIGLLGGGFIAGTLYGLTYGLGYVSYHLLFPTNPNLDFTDYTSLGLIEMFALLVLFATTFCIGSSAEFRKNSDTKHEIVAHDEEATRRVAP